MKYLYLLFFVLSLSVNSLAQLPEPLDTAWSRLYGLPERRDYCFDAVQTAAGGFALAGNYVDEMDHEGVFLVKTDSIGNEIWNLSMASATFCYSYSLIETSDSCFVLVGRQGHKGSLFKIGPNGDSLWSKTFDRPGTNDNMLFNVIESIRGTYVAAGETVDSMYLHQGWMVEVDGDGALIQNRVFGNVVDNSFYDVCQAPDGGYVFAGHNMQFGEMWCSFWLVKTDNQGNFVWESTAGGPLNEEAEAITATSDGGYAVVGKTSSYGEGDYDMWLVKVDSLGARIWDAPHGLSGPDYCHSVVETEDHGFLLGGTCHYGTGPQGPYIVKSDSLGRRIWHRYLADIENSNCLAALRVSDGYVLAGVLWRPIDPPLSQFWLVKTGELTDVPNEPGQVPTQISLTAYPNPFNSAVSFNLDSPEPGILDVYDIGGRLVWRMPFGRGLSRLEWYPDGKNGISSGTYLAKAVADGKARTIRLTYLK